MSGISSDLSSFGLIGRIGTYAVALDKTETDLTAQSTSGLIATEVTDLGAGTGQVLSLQPQLAQLSAFSQNATIAGSRLQTAQTALTSITSMASSLSTSLVTLSTQNGTSLATAITNFATQAQGDLGTLMGLLNTSAGDTYVFGAPGTVDAPVLDPNDQTNGSLSTAVANVLSSLQTNGVSSTLTSIANAVTTANLFSSTQSPPAESTIAVGVGEQAIVGFTATTTTGMPQPGGSFPTTGSGVQDLIAVLSTMANLNTSDAQDPNFQGLVTGLQTMLGNAQGGLSAIVSTLGVSQQQVSAASDTNDTTLTALETQIGDLTSVDLPTVATQLTATQNQLTASYEIINDLKGMTLAAYI